MYLNQIFCNRQSGTGTISNLEGSHLLRRPYLQHVDFIQLALIFSGMRVTLETLK